METLPANIDAARRQYQTELNKSPSSKGRCRHYVAGALHRNIPKGAYIVRPISDGAFDFIVSIQIPRLYSSANGPVPDGLPDESKFEFVSTSHNRTADTASIKTTTEKLTKWVTQRESVVKVRYLKGGSEYTRPLLSIRDLGEQLHVGVKNVGSCRAGYGDFGKMYPLGSRVTTEEKVAKVVAYKCNAIAGPSCLVGAVSGLYDIGMSVFPSALRSLQDSERMYGLTALEDMEKSTGSTTTTTKSTSNKSFIHQQSVVKNVSLTIDCSSDLSNSSHYDVNDGSVGYAVWTESCPGLAENWYFILPTVYGETPTGEPFSGLAIELSHGVAIQWDGRVIRHCTSMMHTPKSNHVYGTFCAAKSKLVDFGLRSFRESKIRQDMIASRVSEDNVPCNSEGAELSDCSVEDSVSPADGKSNNRYDDDGSMEAPNISLTNQVLEKAVTMPNVVVNVNHKDPLADFKIPRRPRKTNNHEVLIGVYPVNPENILCSHEHDVLAQHPTMIHDVGNYNRRHHQHVSRYSAPGGRRYDRPHIRQPACLGPNVREYGQPDLRHQYHGDWHVFTHHQHSSTVNNHACEYNGQQHVHQYRPPVVRHNVQPDVRQHLRPDVCHHGRPDVCKYNIARNQMDNNGRKEA